MPLEPSPPIPTTARCWSCRSTNPTHIMPDVRLMRCQNPACQATHPADTDHAAAIRRMQFAASQTSA